jgi:hypothetical protein
MMKTTEFHLGRVSVLLAFCLVVSSVSIGFANTNTFRPVKTLCGAKDTLGKPFVVMDFDTTEASGTGSTTDKFAQIYTDSTYPVPNYRLVHVSGHRFRIGTQIVEQTYSPGQYMAYLSIYEEVQDKLIQRSYTALPIDSLVSSFRFIYEIPNASAKITCFVSPLNSQTSNGSTIKDKPRKPAKSDEKGHKKKK